MIELATARQRNDLDNLDGYTFYPDRADRVCDWIERYCRHGEGEWAGQRIQLEEWQREILRAVFGWYRDDGTRRFNEAYIEVGRKNGKTFLAAAVALYLMIADGEPGAQIYSTATKKDQAKLSWNAAESMVKASPVLSQHIKIVRTAMFSPKMNSKFQYLGADSRTLDGLNPHACIIDELHEHKDRRVYDKINTAYGSRRNPLNFIITTAGIYDPESIGLQKHEHAVRVLNGDLEDESFFAFLACADKEDDPYDRSTWEKANPNLGVSVYESFLEKKALEARQQPSFYNSFLRYHLNIWPQSVERWLSTEAWQSCDGEVDVAALEGRECWAGLDMSSTQDLTAFVLCFPPEDHDEGEWIVLPYFWLPEERARERDNRDGTTYATWVRQGYIDTVPGNVLLDDPIMQGIVELSGRFPIQEIWYDPYTANRFAVKLTEWYGIETVQCRQGTISMNEPCRLFERLVYSGRLRHGNNPVLRWMASHTTVRTDSGGLIKPDKSQSREKIDGIVAAAMAVGAASTGGGELNIYDDREPLEITL